MEDARRDIHRIGGATVENLRLKPAEALLPVPGISVIRASDPREAADQLRRTLRPAAALSMAARVVASARLGDIRSMGFDIIPMPTRRFPSHCRLVHPDGAAGFSDDNLERLAQAFEESTGL